MAITPTFVRLGVVKQFLLYYLFVHLVLRSFCQFKFLPMYYHDTTKGKYAKIGKNCHFRAKSPILVDSVILIENIVLPETLFLKVF